MKYHLEFLCVFIGFFVNVTAYKQRLYISNQSKRLTHATIHGEIRGDDILPVADKNSHLVVELRRLRDDLPQTIARTQIKLTNNRTMDSFVLKFKLKYPLSEISPQNKYVLSAKIRNGQTKLLYIGDLPVPITERKEKKAEYLIINVAETRKLKIFFKFIITPRYSIMV